MLKRRFYLKNVITKLIILVCPSAPVEQTFEVTPAVSLNRIGMSSEWSGHSKPAATASHNETKPWTRSKVRTKSPHWLRCEHMAGSGFAYSHYSCT